MRGFFLLLLITNLSFIAWQLWSNNTVAVPHPYGEVALRNEGLTLLSEINQDERPGQRNLVSIDEKPMVSEVTTGELARPVVDEAQTTSNMSTDSSLAVCYKSSMFSNLDEAKAFQATLGKLGIEVSQRKAVETTKINYWVMLKPYQNRVKANEAADLLRKKRVRDFFIIPSGRYENAVSLGVFSTRERAEQRQQEISELKIRLRKPVVEALELPTKHLIVLFKLAPGVKHDGLDELLNRGKEPYLEKIRCNS